MPKKVLFIDRDGTLLLEPEDYQVDSMDKFAFYPTMLQFLPKIAKEMDFELVMVSNQDGLGTDGYPEVAFNEVQEFLLKTLAGERVKFKAMHIDKSFASDNLPTRKPGIGMLTDYFSEEYDLKNSYVIGDRWNDVKLAANLGCKAIWICNDEDLGGNEAAQKEDLTNTIALKTIDWESIYRYLRFGSRAAIVQRKTNETDVLVKLDLNGSGVAKIDTGLHFFNHMLEQIARHGDVDLEITTKGDLHIDEHHTIEDTGIALGTALKEAIGNKLGVSRYGFCLPMDDCLAQVAIDFGGRSWLVWDAEFKREKVGDFPTEMTEHFFKSLSDAAHINLNISVGGNNEHHKIESIFKAFARALKMAKTIDYNSPKLPSTKGQL